LDAIKPGIRPARDATYFRRIIAARKAVAQAVAGALPAGELWTVSGTALDATRQAAFQQFGKS
jgi:hypothetical protein